MKETYIALALFAFIVAALVSLGVVNFDAEAADGVATTRQCRCPEGSTLLHDKKDFHPDWPSLCVRPTGTRFYRLVARECRDITVAGDITGWFNEPRPQGN